MTSQPDQPASGGPVVLVVDDMAGVRCLLCDGLRLYGFEARDASDGAEAVELLRQRPGEIALALVDLYMPGMTGRETIAALKAVKPGLPCCLMGGYLRPEDTAGADAVLQKPFTPGEGAETVRELLAGGG